METLRVLSVLQPWASLIVLGHKPLETRSWSTGHRGRLLIHAAKRLDGIHWAMGTPRLRDFLAGQGLSVGDLPLSSLVGEVQLQNIAPLTRTQATEEQSQFGWLIDGPLVWRFGSPRAYEQVIPACGQRGLWSWSGVINASV